MMGVLAQAKNGDAQFWNIEISCSQCEGQHALKVPGFFSFSLCSQHVLVTFPMSSHQVPTLSPIFCPCHQPRPKMAKQTVLKQKFHAGNAKAQHALMIDPIFFFLFELGVGTRGSCFFPLFPMYSHQVPKVFQMRSPRCYQ